MIKEIIVLVEQTGALAKSQCCHFDGFFLLSEEFSCLKIAVFRGYFCLNIETKIMGLDLRGLGNVH